MSARDRLDALLGDAAFASGWDPSEADRILAEALREAAERIEPYVGTELSVGSVVMILRNMANAVEGGDPLRHTGELPGMWEESDLSGGWTDSEPVEDLYRELPNNGCG